MGWLSDSCRSKYGRRKPFMMTAAPFYAGFMIALMSPLEYMWAINQDEPDSLPLTMWFGIFYVIFYLADTAANVPHSALGPELSDDSAERDNLFFYSKMTNQLGILMAVILPPGLSIVYSNSCASGDSDCEVEAQGAAFRVT